MLTAQESTTVKLLIAHASIKPKTSLGFRHFSRSEEKINSALWSPLHIGTSFSEDKIKA